MPVVRLHAELVGEVDDAGVVHPLDQRVVRLRGQVDEDAPPGLVDRGLDDGVERLVVVDRTGEAWPA